MESIRIIENDSSRSINREQLRIIQTPQTFLTKIILPAFRQDYQPSFTDEANVVESHGTTVHLINGAMENIKVTTPEDMLIAETLLKVSA